MRTLFTVLFAVTFAASGFAQDTYSSKIKTHQLELNKEFKSKEDSPLTKKDRRKFKALDFYPIDSTYRIKAKFVRTASQKPFRMETTTDRRPVYEKYGEAHFTFNGQDHVLEIYQSHRLREMAKYKDHLFLPFRDRSCGNGSYGGGRYLDLNIPDGEEIILDFNLAYNPYCAYNSKFSCPIVPKINSLKFEVKAGVKAFEGGDKH